jgi:hypothetical protein
MPNASSGVGVLLDECPADCAHSARSTRIAPGGATTLVEDGKDARRRQFDTGQHVVKR